MTLPALSSISLLTYRLQYPSNFSHKLRAEDALNIVLQCGYYRRNHRNIATLQIRWKRIGRSLVESLMEDLMNRSTHSQFAVTLDSISCVSASTRFTHPPHGDAACLIKFPFVAIASLVATAIVLPPEPATTAKLSLTHSERVPAWVMAKASLPTT